MYAKMKNPTTLVVLLALLFSVQGCRKSRGGDPATATLAFTRISVSPSKNWAAWSPIDHDCFRVYLRTLRVFHTRRLFTIPGAAHPYPVNLGFYPDIDYDGPYGLRWRSSLDARLDGQPNGDMVYTDPDGIEHVFADDGAGGFVTPVGCCAILEAILGGFRLTDAKRWVKIFDPSGLWTGLERPDCRLIQFTREEDHRLTRIETPEGRVFDFAYAAHLRLASITDFAGRVLGFRYNRAGHLTRIERPLRTGERAPAANVYTYDAADFLRTVLNSAGQSYGTASYNAAGEVTSIATPNGTATYLNAGASVQATARDGTSREFFLNPDGQINRIVFPGGGTKSFEYDGFGRRTGITGTSGKRLVFTYSAAADPREFCNRIAQVTEPADFPATPARTETYEFRPGTDQWITFFKADGTRTDWTYDAKGNMTSMTLPATQTTTGLQRGVWQFLYDALGRRIESETPTGSITTYEYGDGGTVASDLVVREIGDAGAGDDPKTGAPRINETVQYEYDAAGNRTRVTFADGGVQTLAYDAWDNPTSTTNEAGITSLFLYDREGRMIRTERPHCDHEGKPIGTGTAFREFTFDPFGQPLTLRTHDGFSTQTKTFTYASGLFRPSRVVDARGLVTDYTYDFNGRRTSETRAPGTADESTTTWTYANNLLTAMTDPVGNTTAFSYDGFCRRIMRTDPEGTQSLFTYDICDHRTSTTVRDDGGTDLERTRTTWDGAGNIATIELDRITPDETERIEKFYNLRGFLEEERLPGGAVRRLCVDGLGQIVREDELALDKETHFVWDQRRRLVEKREVRGVSTATPVAVSTLFEHDAEGNLARTTDPLGRVTDFAYDCAGNPSLLTTPDGRITNYVWDARGDLRSGTHTDGTTTLTETYDYDAGRELTSQTANGLTTGYTYDVLGRVKGITAGGLQVKSYRYDAANRIVNATDPGGAIDYAYDKLGRIVSKTAGVQQQTFVYDGLGRITRATDRAQDGSEITTERTWDGFGLLLTDTQNGMGVRKTYGIGDRPATLATPNMNYSYEYDTAKRVVSLDRGGRRYMDYTYDPGTTKVKSRTHNSGAVSAFSYDLVGKATRVDSQTPGNVANADFSATRNAAGLVTTQARADGSLAEEFRYDNLGRLLSQKHTVGGGDRTTTYTFVPNSDRLASIANTRDNSDAAIAYDSFGRIRQAGASALTYGTDLHATNMFDDRPANQPALAGRTENPSRVEYRLMHDRWGRVTEVRAAADDSLVASYRYDVFNRPIMSQELEFTGATVLTRHRVFDGCKLVYEASPPGMAGFDLFYVPDPASDSHLASGFDDSFFSENLWQVDTQWVPRQLFGLEAGALQERYDDFSAVGTPHFEFPNVGDHFRGAPSLQTLANPPAYASSYASGLMFTWAGPLDDPFLPRPLPYVPGGLPRGDGYPRVGPVNPPGPAPFAPPLPPPEVNQRDCSDARAAMQAAVDKMQAICDSLQDNQRKVDEAGRDLDEANDRVNGALRNLRDAFSDIAKFNQAVGRIKFAKNVDTAITLLTGAGGLAKGGLKAAKGARKIGRKVTSASSRVARSLNQSAQAAFINSTFVSDASLKVIAAGLKGVMSEGLDFDISITGFLLTYGQLLMGVEVDGVASELRANAYAAFVRLTIAQNARGRAEARLNGLLDDKADLLGQAAGTIGCFEDAIEANAAWYYELKDIIDNGTEAKICFSTYAGR